MKNDFAVYLNSNNTILMEGNYDEIEKYLDNPEYTVVCLLNGQFMQIGGFINVFDRYVKGESKAFQF